MFWRRRQPDDFRAEIEADLLLEIDRLREQGLSEDEAYRKTCQAFGNRTRVQERFYESGQWFWWDLLSHDLRFGLRMLAKSPGSTAAAILTLALGIGANTAIFSLINAVMLRSLPVRQPKQLMLFGKGRWVGSVDNLPNRSWELFSFPFYREFQQKNDVFSDVTAIDSILFEPHGRIGNSAEAEKVKADLVSGNYFKTLGVSPILGRAFDKSEDESPGGHPVAVASYTWWQRRFANNPGVVGTKVAINSTVYTIIGVAPPEFFGTTVGQSPDLWIPLTMEKELSPAWNGLDKDVFQSLFIIGRLKPGVSVEQATANTNVLFKQIISEWAGPQPSPRVLDDIRHAEIELTPAAAGLSELRQQFSASLTILMVIVALVLLIACANVANLLLARAAARQREMAVRMSIGAHRSRLIRQLLVESGLLGLAGAAVGVLLATGATRVLLLMVSSGSKEPFPIHAEPDAPVLVFTLVVTVATVLLFGTTPALYATRLALGAALKEGRGATASPARSRLSRSLVVGQVALSLVLLVGSGLFLRSLLNLTNVDTGFDKRNVLVAGLDPGAAGYQPDARWDTVMGRIEERVGSLPGIRAASFAFFVFDGGGWTAPVRVKGQPASGNDPDVDHNVVGAQYFDALRMPVVLGRALHRQDGAASSRIAIINETMARVYFPGGSPLGRTFSIGNAAEYQNVEVVGVVKDAKYMTLHEEPMPAAFYPHAQHKGPFLYNFVIRCAGDPKQVMPRIVMAIREINPQLPVGDFSTLEQMVGGSLSRQRMVAQLCTFFGLLAAFLACIGIYGVTSYGIARRTNELGIRIALGAERQDVLWMVLRDALRPALMGVTIGLALALAAFRLLESQLFGLKFYDPFALGLAIAAMIVAALLAGFLPARRATRIDPTIALRYE
jgi:predicted permease